MEVIAAAYQWQVMGRSQENIAARMRNSGLNNEIMVSCVLTSNSTVRLRRPRVCQFFNDDGQRSNAGHQR